MNSTRRTLREVFALRRNGYSGPFFVALTLFSMGVWLILPWDTFPRAQTYETMEQFAVEEFWGAGMAFTAFILLVASLNRKPREVMIGALAGAAMWFLLFSSFVDANPNSITVPFSFVMILRCLSIYKEFKTQFDPVTGDPYPHAKDEL